MNEIRQDMLKAFDILLARSRPGDIPDDFTALLNSIKSRIDEHGSFSLQGLVFNYFASFVGSSGMQIDTHALQLTRDELAGIRSFWRTTVVHYDFRTILKENGTEFYNKAIEVNACIKENLKTSGSSKDHQEALQRELATWEGHFVCYTVADLLVASVANILTKIPSDGSNLFDLKDLTGSRYSWIRPNSTEIVVKRQLADADKFLQQLKGEIMLFIDVHILPENCVINLR